jgi:hypothetical protein
MAHSTGRTPHPPGVGVACTARRSKNPRCECILTALNRRVRRGHRQRNEESAMSKGMDQKKSEKKKPAKTMKEKKADKKDKKANKAFAPD